MNERQLLPENLRYLYTASGIYENAKKLTFHRDVILYVTAVILPLSFFLGYSDYKPYIMLLSTFITILVVFGINKRISKMYEAGSQYQEEFDTKVFNIKKNLITFNNELDDEHWKKYEKDSTIKRDEVWYSNIKNPPNDYTDIIYCQKLNLSWDSKIRFLYVIIKVLILLIFIGFGVCTSQYMKKIDDVIIFLYVPFFPLFIAFIQEILLHLDIASKKDKAQKRITQFLDENQHNINEHDIRHLQDYIYSSRKNIGVPTYVNKLYKLLSNFITIEIKSYS